MDHLKKKNSYERRVSVFMSRKTLVAYLRYASKTDETQNLCLLRFNIARLTRENFRQKAEIKSEQLSG